MAVCRVVWKVLAFYACVCGALSIDQEPVIDSVAPKILPLFGGNVMIVGKNFGDVVSVLLKEGSHDLNGESDKGWTLVGDDIQVDVLDGKSKITVKIQGSALPSEAAYRSLRVTSKETGLSASVRDALFFTDDCPIAGHFGRGMDCKDCPVGAVCPGGYRIWPLSGYWNPGENSGYVIPCSPPHACVGGRDSLCSTGYSGYACGECSAGFERRGSGVCGKELHGSSSAVLPIFLVLTLLLLAFMFYIGRRSSLFAVPFIVGVFRVGQAFAFVTLDPRGVKWSASDLWISDVVDLFATPLSGYLPFYGDSGRHSPVTHFFRGISFTLVYFVPLLVAPVIEVAREKLASRRGESRAGEREPVSLRGHVRRAVVAWVWLMSVPIIVVSLRSFPCENGVVLFAAQFGCGSASHVMAMIFAAVTLVALGGSLIFIAKRVSQIALAGAESEVGPDVFASYAFVYGMCRAEYVSLWTFDAVPAGTAVLFALVEATSHGVLAAFSAITSIALVATAAFVACRKPYIGYSNASQVFALSSLAFVVWFPLSGYEIFIYLGTILWVVSLAFGIAALWKARGVKTQLAHPFGYGSMDDDGNVIGLEHITFDAGREGNLGSVNAADGEEIHLAAMEGGRGGGSGGGGGGGDASDSNN